MRNGLTHPSVSTWAVRIQPPVQGDTAWRARTLELLRPAVEKHLQRHPAEHQFTLKSSLVDFAVQREAGEWQPGGQLRLRFADPAPAPPPRNSGAGTTPLAELTRLELPNDRLERLGQRLVGLDPVREEVHWRLRRQWAADRDAWPTDMVGPGATALQALLTEQTPLFLFSGDPGTGKTALAQAVADQYCREAGVQGHLFWLGTGARGNGLVGDFGSRVRAAFTAIRRVSSRERPCFLIIDEADALAMRRSETQAHQEDRAGTATLLQCLDVLTDDQPIAVFLTTNLPETIDAAVRRRGTMYGFPRPAVRARWILLRQWLPQAGAATMAGAALLARGLTPADIERAITRAHLRALRSNAPLTAGAVLASLHRQARTGRV